MSVRLFVGNLPYDATESELREFFSPVGRLARVFLPVDRETGKQRGFAFVEFGSQDEADDAIRRLNNQSFKGRPIAVKEARERENRPAGARPAGGPPRPAGRPQEARMGPSSFTPGGPAGPRPGADGRPRPPGFEDTPARPQRRKSFGSDARSDRKRKLQNRTHKSEWGRKTFLRERREYVDEDLDYQDDLEYQEDLSLRDELADEDMETANMGFQSDDEDERQ